MNLKTISRNVGYALLVSALFMLFSIFISMWNGNDSALAALFISFIITFAVGIFPFIFVRKTSRISLKEGYLIIVLSWLLSFIFGMLPYALWGGPFTLANAFFESVSGFTTTGATILDNVEALPRSLLFWRSSTHFIGGLGVVVFLLLIIPGSSPIRMRLTSMELSSLSRDGYSSRTNKTVYIFAIVYIVLVILAFVSYMLAGMDAFEAVCHAFSVCATGGFSTRTLSIGAFGSRLIEGITMVFMLLASLHFGLIFMAFAKCSLKPLNNPVMKFYLMMLLVFTLIVAFSMRVSGLENSFGECVWNGAFHVLSITTTTGFAVFDNSHWPMGINMIVLVLAVMCGCAGSTTGGVKADRVLVTLKAVGRQVRKTLSPSSVSEVRLGGRYLRDEEVYPHILYICLYAILLVASIVVVLAVGVEPTSAFAGSLSSLSNVGPAIGDIGTYGSYNHMPDAAKLIFCLDMLLGRVEIYPVLAVISMLTGRSKEW